MQTDKSQISLGICAVGDLHYLLPQPPDYVKYINKQQFKGNKYTFRADNLSKLFCLSLVKGSTLIRKNLLSLGVDPFSKGTWYARMQRGSHRSCIPWKNGRKSTMCPLNDTDVLGPVVQRVVSLKSLLRVISLTVLAGSIYNILIFFAEKMWVTHIFQQKISVYLCITQCKF